MVKVDIHLKKSTYLKSDAGTNVLVVCLEKKKLLCQIADRLRNYVFENSK